MFLSFTHVRASSEPGQIKTSSVNEALPQSFHSGHVAEIFWGQDFLERSQPGLPFPLATRLLVFIVSGVVMVFVFKATIDLNRRE